MRFQRFVLWLLGIGLVAVGAAAMLVPGPVVAPTGIVLSRAAAVTDVRAIYGGLELGLGIFLLMGARDATLLRAALLVALTTFAGMLAGRMFGVVVDGGAETVTLVGWAMEVVAVGLIGAALHRAPGEAVAFADERAA